MELGVVAVAFFLCSSLGISGLVVGILWSHYSVVWFHSMKSDIIQLFLDNDSRHPPICSTATRSLHAC